MRRRSPALLVVLLLLIAAGGLFLKDRVSSRKPQTSDAAPNDPSARAPEPSVSPTRVTPRSQNGSATAAPPESNMDPARYRRAYLLALDGGQLKLENTQDIEGDFAPRRGSNEEWSGMLRCRLMSATGQVLTEELIPAPDHLCTVLDARGGEPKAVSYTVPGPVVFQLRLPRLADAARLDVTRVTMSGALKRDQPVGSVSLLSQ